MMERMESLTKKADGVHGDKHQPSPPIQLRITETP